MKLDDLLTRLVELDGTDLYLTVGARPKVSRNGEFVDAFPITFGPDMLRDLVAPLIEDPAAFEARPELDLARRVGETGRFRINVYRQRGEVALVARRIRVDIQSLEDLGLPSSLADLALARQGLVLVTGSTGSGKSTTLAAMIDYRNRERTGHIVTIEDPIEFIHEHRASIISQREVGVDTAAFADALRSALRQAPNVLLIGEIRDRETADAALQFAETGHLVLATLHSTNTSQTLERVLGLFPADRHVQVQMLLATNLAGIVCQRLIPATDGGRAAALEILLPTARIRDLLKKGNVEGLRGAIAEGGRDGMTTFDQSLARLLKSGRIDKDRAISFADNPTDLKLSLSLDEVRASDSGIRLV